MDVVERIWVSDIWRLISVTVVATVLLAVVLGVTTVIGRLGPARPRRRDRPAVLRFEKESGVGTSDGAGAFPRRHSRFDHAAADDLSPDPVGGLRGDASRLARDVDDPGPASAPSAVPARSQERSPS